MNDTAISHERKLSMLFYQSLGDQFGDIHHRHRRFRFFLGGLFGDHAHAERTTGGNRLGAGLFELAVAVGAYPLGALFFVLPELSAAGAAAKAVAARPARLGQFGASGLDQRARLIEYAVVSAEIAGVVISHRASRVWLQFQPARAH